MFVRITLTQDLSPSVDWLFSLRYEIQLIGQYVSAFGRLSVTALLIADA